MILQFLVHALHIGGDAKTLVVICGLRLVASDLGAQLIDLLNEVFERCPVLAAIWPNIEASSAEYGLDGSAS